MEMITVEQGATAMETIVSAMERGAWETADRLAAGLDEAASQGDDMSYGIAYRIYRERSVQ